MSKVTTVSRGWQLECKVVSESRLGIILAIFRHWIYISHGLRKLLGNHLYWAWSENASFWWSRLHCCPPAKLNKLTNRIPRESQYHLSDPPIPARWSTPITAESSPADVCQARQSKAKRTPQASFPPLTAGTLFTQTLHCNSGQFWNKVENCEIKLPGNTSSNDCDMH